MANALQVRDALQIMAREFTESAPLSNIAWRNPVDSESPMVKGKTYTMDRPNVNAFTAQAITGAAYRSRTESTLIALPKTVTIDQDYGVEYVGTDLEWAQASLSGKLTQAQVSAKNALVRHMENALATAATKAAFRQINQTTDALYDLAAMNDKFLLNGVENGRKVIAFPALLPYTSNANILSTLIGKGQLDGFGMDTIYGRLAFSHALATKSFTNGTGTSYVANGNFAVGSRSIVIKTGSGTVVAGDIVTFAGDTQEYLVETGVTAPGTISIYPGLKVALDDGDAMTISTTTAATGKIGLGVHESALAIAFGQEAIPADLRARMLFYETGTYENVTISYEIVREDAQMLHRLRVIYGIGAVYPDGVVKMKLT